MGSRRISMIVKKIIRQLLPTYDEPLQFAPLANEEQNDFFLTGSEDGTVCMYSLDTYTYEKMLTRCTLPIRDIALSPDGQWAAVASE